MTIDRASLPEEFFDRTSGNLLVQPRSDYPYAQLAKMALGSNMNLGAYGAGNLGLPGAASGGTPRGVPNSGMPYTSAEYDRLALMPIDGRRSDFAIVVDEIGQPNVGHTIRINRPKYNTAALFTEASRVIQSAQTITTTGIDLASEQMAITVKRYGGPHDGTQVAPYACDRFDALRMVHSVVNMIGKHMQDDFDKWLDRVICAFLDVVSGSSGAPGAPTSIWPLGISSDNTPVNAGDMPGDVEMLMRAIAGLLTNNIPRFPTGKYMGMISPMYVYNLTQDPLFTTLVKYFPEANPIFNSYVGTINGCDFFQSTNLTSTNNSNGVPVTTHHIFGPGVIALGVARLPEVLSSTDDNYGEVAKLIWAAYLAFALADARFGARLKTG